MNQDDAAHPPFRPRWSLPALFLCAEMMVATSHANAREPGGAPRADTRPSVEAETILTWALNRLEDVKTWDQRSAVQEKSMEQICQQIESLADMIEEAKGKNPHVLGPRLVFLERETGGLTRSGKDQVIVARSNGALHFRIFDHKGQMTDLDETDLQNVAGRLAVLKKYLEPSWASLQLSGHANDLVALGVASIVGRVETDFLDRIGNADEKLDKAATELEAARDRSRSLPPNFARLVLDSAEFRLQNARLERENLEQHTLPKEMRAAGVTARAEVRRLEARRSALRSLEAQERSKLDALRKRAREELSDKESEIIKHLENYIQFGEKGQTVAANKSLAEATRLWRQEMDRQFKSRLRDYQQRPAKKASVIPSRPPGR